MDKEEARQYLASLLNKNLRILATDGRMFLGAFKCTDAVRRPPLRSHAATHQDSQTNNLQDQNVVLANTYEYRQPSPEKVKAAAAASESGSVDLDMTSRYLGLVVVPGHHIVKVEVEHFASQMKSRISLSRQTTQSVENLPSTSDQP